MMLFILLLFLVKSFAYALSLHKAYRIEESGTKGKIAVATRDVKPGELVLEENEPIMYFPDPGKSALPRETEVLVAAFHTFTKELSPEKQAKYLTLFGPTTGKSADDIRHYATNDVLYRFRKEEAHRPLTPEEAEMFVKVVQVAKFNIFGQEGGGCAVFEDLCRFSHSCDANCAFTPGNKSIVCHATRFIKANEELTISYVSAQDMLPTHQRRQKYLETKEFICHCRRCDALGDDTRQFDCFDAACDGVMMVCQPISKKLRLWTNLSYTGVEYVEPHLLPCTVCHRAAPAEYQQKMFALEARLPEVTARMKQRFDDVCVNWRVGAFASFHNDLLSIQFPRRHAAGLPLLKLQYRIKHAMFVNEGYPAKLVRTALSKYFASFENLFPNPHSQLSNHLNLAAIVCCCAKFPPVLLPSQEKELCLKALRTYLIIHGREKRLGLLDDATARVLLKLPPTATSEVCAFCEESPQRAAMTRSRCGQCKKTIYCSAGCQKAHWPHHKKTCVKNNICNNTGNA